ncbi:MAG: uridine kinase [Bacteroidales bacterium]|jgi:uridine kinase|nr:uridine kinase [Bacteroidales bacterium]
MIIIGIAGGSGSGKTTVVKKIMKKFPKGSVSIIPQDAYYKDTGYLTPEQIKIHNFDHPDSIEFDLLVKHLDDLKMRKAIEMPHYDYVTSSRLKETTTIYPHNVVILEGILIFTQPEILKRLDIKVFVDAEADDRVMRIMRRDVQERGRSFPEAMEHYEKRVKLMHTQFIEPSKRFADIIIPQGGQNQIAIDILGQYMQSCL